MADDHTPKVTVCRNGPYMVKGNIPLSVQTIQADDRGDSERWQPGMQLDHDETYALCRCGASKTKPFCDETHTRIHFNGDETASRSSYEQQAEVMEGPHLNLLDAKPLCSLARFCDAPAKVWDEVKHTDQAVVAQSFLRQVHDCPSGRLVAQERNTGNAIERALSMSIGVVEDPSEGCSGPLWLKGSIPVIAADGTAYERRNRLTLCRCGASTNKPFCDGTHVKIKFKASE